VIVSDAAFPAASRAVTVMTLFPADSPTEATVQLVVPLALPDPPVAAFVHVTAVTPTASEAVPASATGVDEVVYVGEEVGEVMAHVGAVAS
jgi:hypothetical protein